MEILIDESGTFAVSGALKGSWCVVSAYASPETEKSKYKRILTDLKRAYNVNKDDEIKLRNISEVDYIDFLIKLGELKGVLLCVATDSGLNKESLIRQHQKTQANKMLENIDEMEFESGKDGVRSVTNQMEHLPVQLYIQLQCQILLMELFVRFGVNYFIQRNPNSLRSFRWRIDQKSPDKKTDFEYAFKILSPVLLQSISLEEPGVRLDWCDYRPMEKYMYQEGEIPNYLADQFPHLKNKEGLDIQKITRDNIKFLDSLSHPGIQIADLLASGLRKLLRLEFSDNAPVSRRLGALMIQGPQKDSPIKFITFGMESRLDNILATVVSGMSKSCHPMIKKG